MNLTPETPEPHEGTRRFGATLKVRAALWKLAAPPSRYCVRTIVARTVGGGTIPPPLTRMTASLPGVTANRK
jgi:hypothetical protein